MPLSLAAPQKTSSPHHVGVNGVDPGTCTRTYTPSPQSPIPMYGRVRHPKISSSKQTAIPSTSHLPQTPDPPPPHPKKIFLGS